MTFRSPGAGRRRLLPALFFVLLLVPTPAPAQWSVDAAVGRAVYDPLASRIGALNASLGVRYRGAGSRLGTSERWLYLSGGTDLGTQGLMWGAAGLGARAAVLRGTGWDLGVELGAHGFGYSESSYEVDEGGFPTPVKDPGDWGGTVEAIPTLAVRHGRFGLELRSGMVGTFGPVEVFDAAEDELLFVAGFDGGASATVEPVRGVQLGAVGRYMRFPEGGYPYLGGSAQLTRGRVALWGFAGRWMSDSLATPRNALGVGAVVEPLPGLQVVGGWQQEPSDPLHLNAPRRSWSVRVSRTLGRSAPALPEVAAPPAPDGTTAIRLPAAAVSAPPSVLGDFTGWKPVPMVRSGPFWEVRLPIAPGIHHYGFQDAGGEWFLPDGLPTADDGMGGKSAILVVP
ncbi:MAG TPA: glycogen-binding domain-containing protein [Longimicrobiaceae bacterium]|nr:glycogen-binding domain-containing protein [Longimicrobiaceae bacterium]